MAAQLQHRNGENSPSQVTVHYDGKIRNLEVDDEGLVEVQNRREAEELVESHGMFEKVSDEEPSHVLKGKTVDEVEKYVRDVESVDRLKELRELEDRKTGKEAIDSRIEEVKEKQPIDADFEEVEPDNEENDEQVEEDEDEDGSQTEE